MPAGGYFGRALVVDVTDGSAATLPLPDAVLRGYLDALAAGTAAIAGLAPCR